MVAALCAAAGSLGSPSAFAGIAAGDPAPAQPLGVDRIIEKNAVARGGLEGWRRIETMVWVGHLESPESPDPNLPFVLVQKRPNKTHFEVDNLGQKSLRIFDGKRGWRIRPGKGGSADVQPFTRQELKFAHDAQGIEGPLIDYAAKGNAVSLVGIEDIEGRRNYHLNVRPASGDPQDIWIDAQTFLDTKYDRTSYGTNGRAGVITVFYRDYKTIEGLQVPGILEIGTGMARRPDKLVIEKIAFNAPLEDKVFTRPGGNHRHGMAMVDIPPPDGYPISERPPAAPASAQAPAPAK